jgi:hypothetical protein
MLFAFSAIITRIDGQPGNLSVDTRQVLGLHEGASQQEAVGHFVEYAQAEHKGYSIGTVLAINVTEFIDGGDTDKQVST